MAEGIAAVGVVASIVQLIDFSARVIRRLEQFHSDAKELPKSIRHISTELPVLNTTLQHIQQAVEADSGTNSAKAALLPVIDGCREQIELLNAILAKMLPPTNASWRTKSKMALVSLHQDDKIEKITKILLNYISTLTFYHTAVSSTLQPRTDKRLAEIRKWLYAPDPSINYQKALKLRQDDTGIWLLESDQYAAWKKSAASFLWLYGIPGCGKTILSATILQNILQYCDKDPGKVVAYFYFDFNDVQKQKPELMLRSLICQLSQQCVKKPASLDTLMSSCENGQRQPALHALEEVAQQMIQDFPHVYIVLDALDECAERGELTTMLETLAASHLQNLHVLLTSRRERNIESSLETFIDQQSAICLQNDIVNKDIRKYVRQRLQNDRSLSKWQKDTTVMNDIETALMEGAHGMFRWAVCQLDTLGKCRNRAMLRRSLATLPPTLDQTYDRILTAISKDDTQYAVRILRWLTFSARPLFIEEIAELAAIDNTREPVFDYDEVLEDPLEVLDICSSLVTIHKSNNNRQIATLAHYSVREYLLSDRIQKSRAPEYGMQDSACHAAIARSCIGYLLQFTQKQPLSEQDLDERKLAKYSAKFWPSHAKMSGDRVKETSEVAIDLFSTDNSSYRNWLRLHNPERPWSGLSYGPAPKDLPAPLYVAALLGLQEVVSLLITMDADVNAQSGYIGNALHVASVEGHEQIVKLLLDAEADVNAWSGNDRSALMMASERGHVEIVKLLLNKGANVNTQTKFHGSALYEASARGHEQIVVLLLDKNVDVNLQGGDYGSALQVASAGGYERIVSLLLEKDADVDALDEHFGSALQAASAGGYEQIVRLLLDKEANVNARVEGRGSALHVASAGGYEQIVKLLLDKNVDVNAQARFYGSPLYTASVHGHREIVKLLLDKDADVNAQGWYHGSALQVASAGGHEQIVKLLLDKDADVNAQGENNKCALQAASERGYEKIVKLLLDKDADGNVAG